MVVNIDICSTSVHRSHTNLVSYPAHSCNFLQLQFPAANSSFSFSISSLGLGSTVLPDPPWLPHIVDVDKMVAQRGASRSAALLTTDSL